MIIEVNLADKDQTLLIKQEVSEILAIIVASLKTAKRNI
jgi:hypothetical protein